MLVPPVPQIAPPSNTLRFAVGDPAGLRSSTWTVVGHKTGDVYIGARTNMHYTKVSLHRSGTWRLAYTSESAATANADGDRVLYRYAPPPEYAPGWRHGATIVVPTSSLRESFPEKRPKGSGVISWWPAPDPGWGMRFDLLLGSAGERDENLTVNGAAGEVGRLYLGDGSVAWVVASAVPTTAQDEELYEVSREATRSAANGLLAPTAMAWGFDNDSGYPVLIDLGDPR